MRCADIRHWDSALYICRETCFSQEVIGVTLTSLILTTLALWCVYRIFLKILPQVTEGKAAVCTFLLSFSPLFFGMTMYFNPDYALAVFLYFCYTAMCMTRRFLRRFFRFCAFRRKKQDWCWSADWCLAFLSSILQKEKPCRKSNF